MSCRRAIPIGTAASQQALTLDLHLLNSTVQLAARCSIDRGGLFEAHYRK